MMRKVMLLMAMGFLIFQGLEAGDPGYYTDSRDGQRYATVEINGRVWLAAGL